MGDLDPRTEHSNSRNSRRADLDGKSSDKLYRNYRMRACHFENRQFVNSNLKGIL